MTDIFVSFAHIDNQPVSEHEKGWITHLVNNLRNEVGRKLGRAEKYEFWMDFKLKGSDELTPAIEEQLAKTHAFVILLSPGWIASEWCQRELKVFSRRVSPLKGRVFVVELSRIDLEDKPAVLHDLLAYRFWRQTDQDKVRQLGYPVPQLSDMAYHDKLADLSDDLVVAIKSRQQQVESAPASTKVQVYVPPVNDALSVKRAKLISEFGQFGIDALPKENELDDNLDQMLAQCSHFVQLLDADSMMGIPYKQHAKALAANKPILQWRDPSLDYAGEGVRAEQKKLLDGKTVIAAPLTDFSRIVREKVLPKPVEAPPMSKSAKKQMVFVHASPTDIERAHAVARQLKSAGYNIAVPRYEGDADFIHKTIERGYQFCNVLLMMHQAASAIVVEECLTEALGYLEKRESKPPIMICQSDDAEELLFTPPDALTLTCRNQFEVNCLEQFLTEVENG